jgi:hypothetical protein
MNMEASFFKNKATIALGVFLFTVAVYLLTWGPLFMGYEKETAMSALALWHGNYEMFRAGPMTAFMYFPFIALGSLFRSHAEAILTMVPLVYSAITAGILFLIFEKLTKKISVSIIASLSVSIGSLMWPYSRIGMEYSAMFFISLLALALLSWEEKNNSPLLVGAALCGAVLTKSYGILFVFPTFLFITLVLKSRGELKKIISPSFLLQLFGLTVMAIISLMAINYHLYGRLQGTYSLGQEFQVWSFWEGWFGTFFSFGKSIFIYSPLLLISAFYWPEFFRKYRPMALFVLGVFMMLLIITVPFSFWSDETLGVRKLMPIVPLLHVPLFLFWEKWGNISRLKKAGIIIFCGFSVYMQFVNSLYPYWRQLELLRPYNLDNLPTIRYAPQLTNFPLNNKFFLSYVNDRLTGNPGHLRYLERSWMRCCTNPPAADMFVANINISLLPFERPDTYIFSPKAPSARRRVFAGLNVIGLLAIGGWLVAIYKKSKIGNRVDIFS